MLPSRRDFTWTAALGTAALGTVALGTAALTSPRARAQAASWPTRPVRVVVPVAAGTATDLTARLFAEKLAPAWGQPLVVENRPGADGLLAIGGFVQARDDHTLLFSFSTAVSLNPLVHAKLTYDADTDLVPVTTTSEVLFAVAVHKDVAAATLAELAAYARANPGQLNWAAAPGLPRFVFERYRREAQLDMAYVPYTQTGTAVQDLGEGRVQVMIASLGTLVPVLSPGGGPGKARLVVVAATDRAAMAPAVPSAVEAGQPGLVVPAVGCVYAWKGIDPALRDRLARDIDRAAQDSTLVARLDAIGQTVRRSTPTDLARLLAEQRSSLGPLAAAMAAAAK